MKSPMAEMGTKLQEDLRKAKQALELAASIMDYCGGDAWERECTKEDRDKFDKLYKEIMNGQINNKDKASAKSRSNRKV